MLEFFRKYQRYFFLVITIVVIISFSFFGTYSTLGSNQWREQIAFTAVDGSEVTRSDVDEMALFLATDNQDKLLYGGVWGPNFLNDGVIRKDFLETGLAQELVTAYLEGLRSDLQRRLEKEKRYTLYSHPQAKFISVTNAWAYLMPEMNSHFEALKNAQDEQEAFNAKVALYLGEKKLPAPTVKQVLRYQEKQFSWLMPDPNLDRLDLSLFGYHTVEDWFGPHFTRLISQFIINSALLAEEKGYEVTKAEALADLIRNTDISYQQNKDRPTLGVRNAEEYFTEQLQRLNMDQARAVKIWRQVLLFRRYFQDAGATALVDAMAHKQFNQFTQETVEVEAYRLPKEFQFSNYKALQNFDVYLNAISKQERRPLELPTVFLTVAEVSRQYPELVQKRYLVDIVQADKKSLQAKISIKDTWSWEVESPNWEALKKEFPELSQKPGDTREERFAALDSLDTVTRSRVDSFARQQIVKSHPEWITKMLTDNKAARKEIAVRPEGGKAPFEGADSKDKRQEISRLLDQAALGQKPEQGSPLYAYTADGQTYYQITVLERANEPEILTFAEAQSDGTLDKVRERLLEKYYVVAREQHPLLYQRANQSWKSFDEAKELVSEQYFEKLLDVIKKETPVAEMGDVKSFSKDQLAAFHFYPYLAQVKRELERKGSQTDSFVKANTETNSAQTLSKPQPLDYQWRLEKEVARLYRGGQEEIVDQGEAFELPVQAWSSVKTPANGDLVFFQVKDRGEATADQSVAVADQVRQAQAALSAEAQRALMKQVLHYLEEKHAISLDYLNRSEEEPASQDE